MQRLTNGAGSKEHIAGTLFPMYGHASGISADQNPKVQMRHMSAIVALKIVNQGDSKKENLEQEKNDSDKRQIVINDITFAVPAYSTSAISQKAIPIVGSFNVDPTNDINSASFTPVTDASSNSVKLEFASTKIDPGASETFYLAVRPFDVSNSVLGGSEERAGLTLSITINGSTRSVEIPAGTKFEAGKVTTLRVPVKLEHPKKSDAVENTNFVKLDNSTDISIDLNGESVQGYILGDQNNSGTITISGNLKDLIKAFDIGFYASAWNQQKTAMTVNNIDLWIHENENTRTQIADYGPFRDAILSELSDDKLVGTIGKGKYSMEFDLTDTAVEIVRVLLKNGVPRNGDLISLTKFIHPSTITFRNIIENGLDDPQSTKVSNMIILDEEPIHKKIDAHTINSQLFANRFPGATFEGLKDMVIGNGSDEATKTAKVLYDNIVDNFSKDANGAERYVPIKIYKEFTFTVPIIGTKIELGSVNIDSRVSFRGILDAFFDSPESLSELLGKLEIEVEIITFPYSDSVADYGEKGAPLTPDTSLNPMILWGLDVYGPNASSPK